MNQHHRFHIMRIALAIIISGFLFFGYEIYLDGTIINPITTYRMEKAELPYDTDYFKPVPLGKVDGVYKVQTEKLVYHPGETVYVTVNLCRNRDIKPIVQWTFINDIVSALPPRQGALTEMGCYNNVKVAIGNVPAELEDSDPNTQYQLHGSIDNQVNPFRKVSYLLVSNYFKIEKGQIGEGAIIKN